MPVTRTLRIQSRRQKFSKALNLEPRRVSAADIIQLEKDLIAATDDDERAQIRGFYIHSDDVKERLYSVQHLLDVSATQDTGVFEIQISFEDLTATVQVDGSVRVGARTREKLREVASLAESRARGWSRRFDALTSPRVFIGHGGPSEDWRDLKDHLSEIQNFHVEAYETGARSGHGIRDVVESMIKSTDFACLILNASDKLVHGEIRSRQNVIHELGLFQGRLGFARAIMLVENDVVVPSNLGGTDQIRFTSGQIDRTFGPVIGAIKREFPSV